MCDPLSLNRSPYSVWRGDYLVESVILSTGYNLGKHGTTSPSFYKLPVVADKGSVFLSKDVGPPLSWQNVDNPNLILVVQCLCQFQKIYS